MDGLISSLFFQKTRLRLLFQHDVSVIISRASKLRLYTSVCHRALQMMMMIIIFFIVFDEKVRATKTLYLWHQGNGFCSFHARKEDSCCASGTRVWLHAAVT